MPVPPIKEIRQEYKRLQDISQRSIQPKAEELVDFLGKMVEDKAGLGELRCFVEDWEELVVKLNMKLSEVGPILQIVKDQYKRAGYEVHELEVKRDWRGPLTLSIHITWK